MSILLAFLVGSAAADSRFYYVDGDDDGEVIVGITNSTKYEFGILDGTDFDCLLGAKKNQPPTGTFTYNDRAIINYALKLETDKYLTLLNDDGVVKYHGSPTSFGGTTIYQKATIDWDITGGGDKKVSFDVACNSDGVKAVPIPGSALLLGSGVLGLVVIGRRRRTKKE
ncbi:hypothetical protein KKG29_05190 [Patescibacteria group bacterium]|nr:hypothetical protein [Patescibacteria group bacterium]